MYKVPPRLLSGCWIYRHSTRKGPSDASENPWQWAVLPAQFSAFTRLAFSHLVLASSFRLCCLCWAPPPPGGLRGLGLGAWRKLPNRSLQDIPILDAGCPGPGPPFPVLLFMKGWNCLATSSWPETPQPRTAYPDQQSHCRLLLPRVPFTTPPLPPAVKARLAGCPGACSSAPRGTMAWLSDHHNVQRLPQQGGVEAGEMLARGPMRWSQNYLDWVHSRGLE